MRRGEITALRWRSIDLDAGQLAVVASTEQTKAGCREKDAKSGRCRTLALPAILVTELRRHRIEQAQAMLSIGVRVTTDHHVVMQADATPLQPNSITHAVTLFMKKRGSKVRLHGMRHSHATHMLVANVHPKIVSERLGHSKGRDHARFVQPCPAGNAGGRGQSGGRHDLGCATGSRERQAVAKW